MTTNRSTEEILATAARMRDDLIAQRERIDQQLELLDAPPVQTEVKRLRDSGLLADMFDMKFGPLAEEPVWKVAIHVLREVGKPLELAELADRIQAAGKSFGGEDAAKSLAAHISKHPEHLKQVKGQAYLAEW